MMRTWAIEHALFHGHVTYGEATSALRDELVAVMGRRLLDEAARRNFERECREAREVPRDASDVEVLRALEEAIERAEARVRSYPWWREDEERGEPVEETHADWLGHAAADDVACVLVGVTKPHMVRGSRRVALRLGKLSRQGLVAVAYQGGARAGWTLTGAGEAMLTDELEDVA